MYAQGYANIIFISRINKSSATTKKSKVFNNYLNEIVRIQST